MYSMYVHTLVYMYVRMYVRTYVHTCSEPHLMLPMSRMSMSLNPSHSLSIRCITGCSRYSRPSSTSRALTTLSCHGTE